MGRMCGLSMLLIEVLRRTHGEGTMSLARGNLSLVDEAAHLTRGRSLCLARRNLSLVDKAVHAAHLTRGRRLCLARRIVSLVDETAHAAHLTRGRRLCLARRNLSLVDEIVHVAHLTRGRRLIGEGRLCLRRGIQSLVDEVVQADQRTGRRRLVGRQDGCADLGRLLPLLRTRKLGRNHVVTTAALVLGRNARVREIWAMSLRHLPSIKQNMIKIEVYEPTDSV